MSQPPPSPEDRGWLQRQIDRTAEDVKELPDWLRSPAPDPSPAVSPGDPLWERVERRQADLHIGRDVKTGAPKAIVRDAVVYLAADVDAARAAERQQAEALRKALETRHQFLHIKGASECWHDQASGPSCANDDHYPFLKLKQLEEAEQARAALEQELRTKLYEMGETIRTLISQHNALLGTIR